MEELFLSTHNYDISIWAEESPSQMLCHNLLEKC